MCQVEVASSFRKFKIIDALLIDFLVMTLTILKLTKPKMQNWLEVAGTLIVIVTS